MKNEVSKFQTGRGALDLAGDGDMADKTGWVWSGLVWCVQWPTHSRPYSGVWQLGPDVLLGWRRVKTDRGVVWCLLVLFSLGRQAGDPL